MSAPPDLLEHLDEALALLRHSPAALFTDIDGTLSPIVSDPLAATIPEPTRDALARLADKLSVVAVTGRAAEGARALVGIDDVVYCGNHGAEWLEGGVRRVEPAAAPYVARMTEIAQRAEREIPVDRLYVEDKGPTVSIHYRNAPDPEAARSAVFDFLGSAATEMSLGEGKMVVEVRPPVELSKGAAARSFARDRGLAAVIAIGDDVSDAGMFRAVREMREAGELRGASVAVLAPDAPAELLASADYALDGPGGVQRFLVRLAGEL